MSNHVTVTSRTSTHYNESSIRYFVSRFFDTKTSGTRGNLCNVSSQGNIQINLTSCDETKKKGLKIEFKIIK